MGETYKSLRIACAEAGVSLSELCRKAGVDRAVPDRWKRKEPKSLETYRKLMEAAANLKQQTDVSA